MSEKTVHVHGKPWRYKVGKKFVQIWDPSGTKSVRSIATVLGPSEALRRAEARKNFLEERWEENNYAGFSVYPRDVKIFIETMLMSKSLTLLLKTGA